MSDIVAYYIVSIFGSITIVGCAIVMYVGVRTNKKTKPTEAEYKKVVTYLQRQGVLLCKEDTDGGTFSSGLSRLSYSYVLRRFINTVEDK